MPVPYADFVAAALQTEPAHLTSIGRCHVGRSSSARLLPEGRKNDTSHHDVLDALAVRTQHGTDFLAEESSAFVHLGFIATFFAAIFKFPSHISSAKLY